MCNLFWKHITDPICLLSKSVGILLQNIHVQNKYKFTYSQTYTTLNENEAAGQEINYSHLKSSVVQPTPYQQSLKLKTLKYETTMARQFYKTEK